MAILTIKFVDNQYNLLATYSDGNSVILCTFDTWQDALGAGNLLEEYADGFEFDELI